VNKSAVKNFAMRARRKLLEEVAQKAFEVGVTKNKIHDIDTFEGGFRIAGRENGRVFKSYERAQRDKLVQHVRAKSFDQVVEEVAYTWFNRFIALRFMEINDYLPTGVRVLSSDQAGKAEPDLIKEALNVDLGQKTEIVHRLQDSGDTAELYRYLLIRQCNQLGEIMPTVFEQIADYTELLLPNNLLAEGNIIRDLVGSIAEYDWRIELLEEEQQLEGELGEHGIEIIGWLYQYYISEKKDEVFAGLKQNIKITKENIPAATQLFTPKWIVKYMVENSLGRLWVESHPSETLKANWKYYLEEAEQEPEIRAQLDALKNPNLFPEEITVLDPAMGSGHILVYAFDVLYDIYISAGYPEQDIPQLILEKNLYGLDIDDRAAQLATFALLMKARSKNRRILRSRPKLNLCSIQESNGIPKEAIAYLVDPKGTALEKYHRQVEVEYLVSVFHDAKEYGSILDVKAIDFEALEKRLDALRKSETPSLFDYQHRELLLEKLPPFIAQARIMSRKYGVVCTNPPYMGSAGMGAKLSEFVKRNYPDSKSDLFAVFIEKCGELLKPTGYQAMITQHAWMFLSSYEKLRGKLMHRDIVNMAHLGARAFEEIGGEVVQTTAFVISKLNVPDFEGTYVRLVDYNSQQSKRDAFLSGNDRHIAKKESFERIPGFPLAYWVSEAMLRAFEVGELIGEIGFPKQGSTLGDNATFIRYWYEIIQNDNKWFKCMKGGEYKRWYGNLLYVLDWENNGARVKATGRATIRSESYLFKRGVTWTNITGGLQSFRLMDEGFFFESTGTVCFINNDLLLYLLGFLNTPISEFLAKLLNPTLHLQSGDVANIPLIVDAVQHSIISEIVNDNISLSRADWDAFEVSWDFKPHPLICGERSVSAAFSKWERKAAERFDTLKANEERLNRMFIDIYGMQNELTPEVADKDVTVRRADLEREIRSLFSYAVGCMFGRYSLDADGLVYAGGVWVAGKYMTFIPDKNNTLPICDDHYFEDDILERFVHFVKIAYREEGRKPAVHR